MPGCLAGAPQWIEQLGLGLCVVEARRDHSAQSAAQQWQRRKSGEPVYVRDGYTFCASTGSKAHDFRSGYARKYAQEEADREKDAYFSVGFRKEYGCFGAHRRDG